MIQYLVRYQTKKQEASGEWSQLASASFYKSKEDATKAAQALAERREKLGGGLVIARWQVLTRVVTPWEIIEKN